MKKRAPRKLNIEWFDTEDGKRHYIKDIPPDELKEILLNNGFVLHDDGTISVRENQS